jgi:hypothetical protein
MNASIRKQVLREPTAARRAWRELASRNSDGISVDLYWLPDRDEVRVHVSDERTGEGFVLEPPKQSALAAFYHPYALKRP